MKTVFVPLLLAMATQVARADYNVRDYGAMGNGVHNDTASIQAAIDACDNAGGGTVFFPTGHYNETGLVVGSSATASNHHQSYVFLEGSAPHAAVLRYVGSTSGIALKFSGTIGGGARRLDKQLHLRARRHLRFSQRLAYLRQWEPYQLRDNEH